MGYCNEKVTHFTESGEVDLKAELEARYGEILAIHIEPGEKETVSVIALRNKEEVTGMVTFSRYYPEEKILSVKPVTEDEYPSILAPREILEKLTPTDDNDALEWRGDSWRAIAEDGVSLEELVTYAAECSEYALCYGLCAMGIQGDEGQWERYFSQRADIATEILAIFFTDKDLEKAKSMVEEKRDKIHNTPGYEGKYYLEVKSPRKKTAYYEDLDPMEEIAVYQLAKRIVGIPPLTTADKCDDDTVKAVNSISEDLALLELEGNGSLAQAIHNLLRKSTKETA